MRLYYEGIYIGTFICPECKCETTILQQDPRIVTNSLLVGSLTVTELIDLQRAVCVKCYQGIKLRLDAKVALLAGPAPNTFMGKPIGNTNDMSDLGNTN